MRIRCVDGCVEMCIETCTYAFQLVDRESPRERFVSFSMRRASEEKISTQNQNIERERAKKKDLLLLLLVLLGLTSGLQDNDGDDGIVAHIHIHTLERAFTVKRRKTDVERGWRRQRTSLCSN